MSSLLAKESRSFHSSPVNRAGRQRPGSSKGECLPQAAKEETGPEPVYAQIFQGFDVFKYEAEYETELGFTLPEYQLAYETWGELNANKDNAILLHTGLSASSHARSQANNPSEGWWEKFIGPGLAIDTNRFFVICVNVLGGCYGSTGPSSVNPRADTPGERYGTNFPIITVGDIVRTQFKLIDSLGIDKLYASVGSSLGGMQSLYAAAHFPDRVGRCVSISAAARSHPMSIALRYAQRRVLMSDPNWAGGHYYENESFPFTGMKHAREIATISYRSGPEWEERFGRKRIDETVPHSLAPDFLIESYLDHQGEQFCTKYDPNSLLYISKAMDTFDLGDGAESFEEGVARITCRTLIIGVQSDLLFPVFQQKEITNILRDAGRRVTYYELDALYGHDTFLIDVQNIGSAIKGHLEHECCG